MSFVPPGVHPLVLAVDRYVDLVCIHRDGRTDVYDPANAALLLAGVEVALARLLIAAKYSRCIKCGRLDKVSTVLVPPVEWDTHVCHCPHCGGVLAPSDTPPAEEAP